MYVSYDMQHTNLRSNTNHTRSHNSNNATEIFHVTFVILSPSKHVLSPLNIAEVCPIWDN